MNISKINNANAVKIYAEATKKLNTEKADGTGKNVSSVDAAVEKGGVNISREAKNMNVIDFAAERIKADMNKENREEVSAERISQLKNLMKSGVYNVSTDELASALISGIGNQ